MITVYRADAHLGHNIEHTAHSRLDIIVPGLGIGQRSQFFLFHQFLYGFQRQIRVYRRQAVPDQGTEMMDLSGFTRFQDQADVRTDLLPD